MRGAARRARALTGFGRLNRIFIAMRDWVEMKFSPLLKLRNTVGYWKPQLRSWTEQFASGRYAALKHAWCVMCQVPRGLTSRHEWQVVRGWHITGDLQSDGRCC